MRKSEASTRLSDGDIEFTKQDPDSITTFEEVYDHIGHLGKSQILILVIICLSDITSCMSILSLVYTGATPSWQCTEFTDIGDSLGPVDHACSINNTYHCIKYSFTEDFTSIVSQWELICEKDYVSDMTSTLQMVGLAIGAGVFAEFSDVFCRKYSFYSAYMMQVVFGFLSAASPNWQTYMFFRILVGVGFGGTLVINFVYPLEFVAAEWRVLCGTIGFWGIGGMLIPGIAALVPNWIYFIIVTNSIGTLYLLTWKWLPESPRWLVQKHRYEEASEVLHQLADINGRHGAAPSAEALRRVMSTVESQEREAREKGEREGGGRTRYTYIDLFKHRHYLKITIVLIIVWFSVFVSYYFVSFDVKNLSGNRYLNMFFSGLADLMSQLSVIFILNRIGRKISMVMFLFVAIVCMVVILCLQLTDHTDNWYLTASAMIGKACMLSGTYVVAIYSAEIYPTAVRNAGVGIGSVFGRIGGIVAPPLVYLGTKWTSAPFLICGALTVGVFPLFLMLPETNGEPLTDAFITAAENSDDRNQPAQPAQQADTHQM